MWVWQKVLVMSFTPFELKVGATGRPDLLEIEGLFNHGLYCGHSPLPPPWWAYPGNTLGNTLGNTPGFQTQCL